MLQPGSQIGRYEIQRKLGRGGMGTVYVAHDPVLGRMVAIKVFQSDLDLPDAAERFAREARSAAALNHSNIVTIHDFGDVASQPYIVMEYVQGETLSAIIRRKAPVAVAEKLRWLEELCAGVSYAHQGGVLHRDLKPPNLMIDRTGRLKVLDFGIAKMLGTLATNATALIGTPGYMAPEQIVGGAIDFRSDLFSIAVVAYELLAYAEAFPGPSAAAITQRIVSAEPVPLAQHVPDINPDLVAAIERGLRKTPAERYPNAEAFRAAIARVRHQFERDAGGDSAPFQTSVPQPSAGGGRGTGSARRQVPDAVGVAQLTPTPDPRRNDREAIARRRAAQISASLDLARQHLQGGRLEQAQDACEQALTLDDVNTAALELEHRIRVELGKQRALSLVTSARQELARGALTAAQSLLQEARTLDPEVADARRLERDLKVARAEQERLRQRAAVVDKAVASARSALARKEIETALVFARQALDLDSSSVEAHAIETDAMRMLNAELALSGFHTVVAAPPPGKAPTAAKNLRAAAADLSRRITTPLKARATVIRSVAARAPKRQKQIAAGVAAGLAIVAIVAAAVMNWPSASAPPTGSLVLEAVPWATVTFIQSEDGTSHPVPPPGATPMSLALPAGTYQIRVSGPPPESESRLITVRIEAGAVAAPPVERFRVLTPAEYFEQYLMSPAQAAADQTEGLR
jgi:serine/threonine protein kinase